MGHIRLKRLPATRKWKQVVGLLVNGTSVQDIAAASADAAQDGLQQARRDPVLAYSFWLLTQIPLAARAPEPAQAFAGLGLDLPAKPLLLDAIAAFSEA